MPRRLVEEVIRNRKLSRLESTKNNAEKRCEPCNIVNVVSNRVEYNNYVSRRTVEILRGGAINQYDRSTDSAMYALSCDQQCHLPLTDYRLSNEENKKKAEKSVETTRLAICDYSLRSESPSRKDGERAAGEGAVGRDDTQTNDDRSRNEDIDQSNMVAGYEILSEAYAFKGYDLESSAENITDSHSIGGEGGVAISNTGPVTTSISNATTIYNTATTPTTSMPVVQTKSKTFALATKAGSRYQFPRRAFLKTHSLPMFSSKSISQAKRRRSYNVSLPTSTLQNDTTDKQSPEKDGRRYCAKVNVFVKSKDCSLPQI